MIGNPLLEPEEEGATPDRNKSKTIRWVIRFTFGAVNISFEEKCPQLVPSFKNGLVNPYTSVMDFV